MISPSRPQKTLRPSLNTASFRCRASSSTVPMKRRGIGGGPAGPAATGGDATGASSGAPRPPGCTCPSAAADWRCASNLNGFRPAAVGRGGVSRSLGSPIGSTTASRPCAPARLLCPVARTGPVGVARPSGSPPKFHHSARASTTNSPASSRPWDRLLASMSLRAEERGELQRQGQRRIRVAALGKRDVLDDDELRCGFQVVDEAAHVAVLALQHHRDLHLLERAFVVRVGLVAAPLVPQICV